MTCNRCHKGMVRGFYCLSCGYVPPKGVNVYSIYRYFQHGKKELIAEGLTLAEVKEHCSSNDTRGMLPSGEQWFDGFVKDSE